MNFNDLSHLLTSTSSDSISIASNPGNDSDRDATKAMPIKGMSAKDTQVSLQQPVISFIGESYPLLFFPQLFKRIQAVHDIEIQPLKLAEADTSAIRGILEMAFLGEKKWYWLGNLSELDAKKQQWYHAYVAAYQGPHTLIFFHTTNSSSESKASNKSSNASSSAISSNHSLSHAIELPMVVTASEYRQLATILYPDLGQKAVTFAQKIFVHAERIPLESACLLLSYNVVIGANADAFMQDWLTKLIVSEKSLFLLSQHFFAKNKNAFLSLWHEIRADYGDAFWITFWSEQIWRAYYFVKMQKKSNIIEAKKIAYRLPFSLMQRDWRNLSLEELAQSHQQLYELDWQLKNGGSDKGLDAFFAHFF